MTIFIEHLEHYIAERRHYGGDWSAAEWNLRPFAAFADGGAPGLFVRDHQTGGHVERFAVEVGALAVPGVRLRVIAGTEIRCAQKLRQFMGIDIAVPRHQRRGVLHPSPRLAGEGEIGLQAEDVFLPPAGLDGQIHADGFGPCLRAIRGVF